MQDNLQQTVDFSNNDRADVRQGNPVEPSMRELRLPFASAISSGKVKQRYSESTRKLLHQRLLFATAAMLCILVMLKLVGLVFAGHSIVEFSIQMSTAFVLAGVIAFLFRTPQASMRRLRLAGTVAAIAVVVDFVWVLVSETGSIIATGKAETLPSTFLTISFALSIFIAIYGIFIPSDWRRTAVTTGLFALIPTLN